MISAVACIPKGAAKARPRTAPVDADLAEGDQLAQQVSDAGADSMDDDEWESDADIDAPGEEAAVRS
jgi:hypothetical protein